MKHFFKYKYVCAIIILTHSTVLFYILLTFNNLKDVEISGKKEECKKKSKNNYLKALLNLLDSLVLNY
jgi:hypothetical protein